MTFGSWQLLRPYKTFFDYLVYKEWHDIRYFWCIFTPHMVSHSPTCPSGSSFELVFVPFTAFCWKAFDFVVQLGPDLMRPHVRQHSIFCDRIWFCAPLQVIHSHLRVERFVLSKNFASCYIHLKGSHPTHLNSQHSPRSETLMMQCKYRPLSPSALENLKKFVKGFNNFLYESALHRLCFFHLVRRKISADLICMYKISHGIIDFPWEEVFASWSTFKVDQQGQPAGVANTPSANKVA